MIDAVKRMFSEWAAEVRVPEEDYSDSRIFARIDEFIDEMVEDQRLTSYDAPDARRILIRNYTGH